MSLSLAVPLFRETLHETSAGIQTSFPQMFANKHHTSHLPAPLLFAMVRKKKCYLSLAGKM